MEKIGIIQLIIILVAVTVKFGVILFTVFYVRQRSERKKREFLEAEYRRKYSVAQSAPIASENQ